MKRQGFADGFGVDALVAEEFDRGDAVLGLRGYNSGRKKQEYRAPSKACGTGF